MSQVPAIPLSTEMLLLVAALRRKPSTVNVVCTTRADWCQIALMLDDSPKVNIHGCDVTMFFSQEIDHPQVEEHLIYLYRRSGCVVAPITKKEDDDFTFMIQVDPPLKSQDPFLVKCCSLSSTSLMLSIEQY